LGLPEREFYLSSETKKKEMLGKYKDHVARIFELAGTKPDAAKQKAVVVLRFEKELAVASTPKEDLRDPEKVYNRLDRVGLKKISKAFDWDAYLRELGATDLQAINVAEPRFMAFVDLKAKSASPADWRTYLEWQVLSGVAQNLSSRFVEESYALVTVLTGQAKRPPRWKLCVRAVDEAMGEALGRAFVRDTLGTEGKEQVGTLLANIELAMERNLAALTWMDEGTRAKAKEKLEAIANMVAYPDKWRNYDGLSIDRGDYLANQMRSDGFELARQLAKIGKPVDKREWFMSPPTVNAYYEPTLNQMVFPAGILQSPFYGASRGRAVNYGGIGMVMGHELTHGFDDEGRQFDAKGNLSNWWSGPVNAEFEKRAACVEQQFGEYTVPGGDKVNGKLTLGENIADLGGIKLAFAAFRSEQQQSGSPQKGSRFSPEQEFFLGFAQAWCTKARDEYLQMLVATNPHAPPRYRVNGPLSNTPEFAESFGCTSKDRMVRSQRCSVW
jgi:predicted metalloendopeptidase